MIHVGDKQVTWREGLTVEKLLEALDKGDFYAVVRVNGKLVSRPKFARTPVPDGSRVELIPMVAGG